MTGIVIVGAGIAGLYTALKLSPHPVTVVTAGHVGRGGSSRWAQGGLAAAMGGDDSAEDHLADTMAAGAGLVEEHPARILCEEGPDRIRDLLALGVPFDHEADGLLKLGREAAHGKDRIVHVGGDEAGATIMRILTERALETPSITLLERHVVHRVETDGARVTGIAAWDAEAQEQIILHAEQVVIATGGMGGLYAVTTNPLHAQGHGLAMAYEAGAALRDLEFVQFHPTALDVGRDPAPLATEALRGAGATLHDTHGRRFMVGTHEDAELAPRDIVARGVAKAIADTGYAYLDTRQSLGPKIKSAFPTVYESAREASINPIVEPLPVAPAVHYHMGGIETDTEGRTTLPGLWAVGECASTGVHGANRLASNSLLEALVFGYRAAEALGETQDGTARREVVPALTALPMKPPVSLGEIRKAMAEHAGLLRSADGLQAVRQLIEQHTPQTEGDRLSLLTAGLIVEAALARTESRGSHTRTDHPDTGAPRHSISRKTTP